jgi:hypothetical protein
MLRTPPRPLSDADNRLLQAWRRGDLDAEASHAFETRLFLEPDLLRAAQIDQALADGLRDEAATTTGSSPAPRRGDTARRRTVAWTGWALAAGLAGVAVWPMLGELGVPAPVGNVEWVSLDVRRGSDDLPLVAPRAETGLVALELGAPAASGRYAVHFRHRDSGAPALSVSDLTASDGVLSLAFERNALPAGDYVIELRAAEVPATAPAASSLAFRYRP